jgi:hypothetical protein
LDTTLAQCTWLLMIATPRLANRWAGSLGTVG